MPYSQRVYDVSSHDDLMKQIEWRAAQNIQGQQRERTRRTANRITSGLGAVAASLAIYDLAWLVLGIR
jgi:hypothetical protein